MQYGCSFKETTQLSHLGGGTSHVCRSHLVGPWALLYPPAWALVSQTNWQETTMLRGSDWQQTMKAHSGWDLAACVCLLWSSLAVTHHAWQDVSTADLVSACLFPTLPFLGDTQFSEGGVGATAIHIYPLLRFRIWWAYMEYKQRRKVISAEEDLRRALGVICIEDKSNELWPLQRSNQFIFSSSSSYDHCDPDVLTAENRAKDYSSISKSVIWAHANCPNALLKTTMLQEPRWPFPKSRKKMH